MLIAKGIENAIFHWYSGNVSVLKNIVNSGFFFSINSAMIQSDNGKKIIAEIPKELVLTETDFPYLKKSNISEIHSYLSKLWNVSDSDTEKIINENIKIKKNKIKSRNIEFLKKIEFEDSCSNFYQEYYGKNLKKEHLEISLKMVENAGLIPRIASSWICGFSLDQIADNLKKSVHFIKRIIDTFTLGTGIPKIIQFGHAFEHYWSSRLPNCKVGGKKSEMDLIFHDKNEKVIGCAEVKLFNQKRNQITIYLDNENHTKSLRPSVEWCKKNNVRFFPLFFRMNKWKNDDGSIPNYCIIIDVNGKSTINLKKAILNENYKYEDDFIPEVFFSKKHQKNGIKKAINDES